MAIIKVTNSKGTIGNIINYVTQPEKTEEKLITGKDCSPLTVIEEMKATKELFNKTKGRQYIHFVQSFRPDELKDNYQKAHEIGTEWAEDNFTDYEVLIATHKDTDHVHNHFIVNSVSFQNGKKYQQSKKDLKKLKENSDLICKREGLSVIERDDKIKYITTFSMKKYKLFKRVKQGENKDSYIIKAANIVEKELKKAGNKENFIKLMKESGYRVSWNDKYITFIDQAGRKVRNINLEKTFKNPHFSNKSIEKNLNI